MKKLNQLEKDLLKAVRKHNASYYQITNAMKTAYANIEKPKREKKLHLRLTNDQMASFIQKVNDLNNSTYKLWMYLFMSTGIRIGELVNIKIQDVILDKKCILIHGEKNESDRYALILSDIYDLLKMYIELHPNRTYLFEHTKGPYTVRAIQKIFKKCRDDAGIDGKFTPHSFRHEFCTLLAESGMNDAQRMLFSGHQDQRSLKHYDHLAVDRHRDEFENAIGGFFRKVVNGSGY